MEEIYYINQKSEMKGLIRFSMCGTTFPDKSYRINRRRSKIACIEYIEEGSGTVHIGEKTFSASAGDSYFLMTGKDHIYYSDSERPWKKHFINLHGKLLEGLAEGYGIADTAYFEGLDLGDDIAEIISIAKREEADATDQLILILNKMFMKMHRHMKKQNDLSAEAAEMKDFLNTKITSEFKIEQLCKHISKSESQTIRTFKKAYGTTPYAYVLEKKISLAKKLLADTNLTVKEIAEKLCFADEYYFSNLFKSKVGKTPSAYRKAGR